MSDSVKVNFASSGKSQVKEDISQQNDDSVVPTSKVETDPDLNKEYVDKRSVTIGLVKNYSLYRKANDKVLNARRDYIGSSINSSMTLASNKVEIETYFPNILGIAPNHPNFITRVKEYLNNIQIPVDELGKTFDTTFIYNTKAEYLEILRKENAIEDEFNAVSKNNLRLLKEALKTKIYKLNLLESSKCTLGRPANVTDYLMYRHCLLYNDIAKDISLINSDPNIRFYFKDDKKEKDKLKKLRLEANKAKQNFVACIGDNTIFDAVYIQYCIVKGRPIVSSLMEDDLVKEQNLDKFSTEDPVKFNKIFNDKDVRLKGTIEQLVARGELIRLPHNQNITTSDGRYLGANINEVVAWFKSSENTELVNAYYNKLKNI